MFVYAEKNTKKYVQKIHKYNLVNATECKTTEAVKNVDHLMQTLYRQRKDSDFTRKIP